MEQCPVCNSPIDPKADACPSCGFKRIGATQEFKPIALDDEGAVASTAKPQVAQLVVVRGPQQIDTAYDLTDRPMTVGRSPHCDIFLNDMTVSREHALVQPVGAQFAIRDTNSFNGVWVNNENVSQAILHDGDVVQVGAFVLTFHG